MKWKALIVLMALALSIVAPPSLPWLANTGSEAEIGTLDVCHSAMPALSGTGDMPCMNECPCVHAPLMANIGSTISHFLFKPQLIAFQDERPPRS